MSDLPKRGDEVHCPVADCQWHGKEEDFKRHIVLVTKELNASDGHEKIAKSMQIETAKP